jgi:hypothetical protein
MNGNSMVDSWAMTPISRTNNTYSSMGGRYCNAVSIKVNANVSINMTISPMFTLKEADVTTFQPYKNICHITGWTAAKVTRTGKNLFDKSTGIQFTNYNVLVARNTGYGVPFKFKKGVTYTISCNSATKPTAIYILEPYTPTPIAQISKSNSITISPTEDTEAGINFYWSGDRPSDATDILIELGSTATSYEPYQGNTYDITFPTEAGTVYGGTLDVTNGVLTVDTVCATKALSAFSLVETKTNTKHYRYSNNFFGSSLPLDSESGNLCNIAPNSYNSKDRVHFYPVKSNGRIEIWVPTDLTTSTEVQIAAPIATPITYQLTPQEVQMLLGENYVWASSGDTVSVTYYAEGNANALQSLNILLGGNYSNPKTADDVSDKEALEIILGGNK